ncbi:MAG TPA: DHHA2 domain-containing protein, partial [Ktedonobacteraceae bacterium]|nr:DHHA2 domain-containing protein [Ktedonobacteraceae bacterium]
LAGLLYDTLILRSPTCTPRDERVALELARITGETLEEYGRAIFDAAAEELDERGAEELLTSDFKEFTVQDSRFAVGTVETASPAAVEKRLPELLASMRTLVRERGYTSFLFMIVDIINLRCHLLIAGGEQAVADTFNVPLESDGHTIIVEDLVSRKKQVVPQLARIHALLAGKA